jgi:hypothetical protein
MWIDSHLHLYSPEINRAPGAWAKARSENHWATLCTRVRQNGRAVQAFPTIDEMLRAMDDAKVERGVLLGWYWENHDTCTEQNRFFAQCLRTHGDRLSAFAALHPRAGAAALQAEISYAVENGFCGIGELSPHAQGTAIDDPGLRLLLELAAERGLPVNLHVTESAGKPYPGRVTTPLTDFVHLAREHPRTTFILAHWGARLPLDPALGAQVRTLRNVFYDTAASPLLYPPSVFREFVSAAGADRVLFGSDFPLNLYPKTEPMPSIRLFLEEALRQDLNAAEREAVFGGNARRLLKLRS